jgi:hypothetical protein
LVPRLRAPDSSNSARRVYFLLLKCEAHATETNEKSLALLHLKAFEANCKWCGLSLVGGSDGVKETFKNLAHRHYHDFSSVLIMVRN